MSSPAPPPAPPPGGPPVLSTDASQEVDQLATDTNPDAPPTPGEDKTKGDDGEAKESTDAAKPDVPEEEIGSEYKKRADRGCTDILCCCLMLVFMLVWVGVAYVAFTFGQPYSIIYGLDYEGNLCGYQCSQADGASASSNCTKDNILKKKYAHFPRITSDLLSQSDTIAQGKIPSFYTLCVEECPAQWDIICSYDFDAANSDWKTTPRTKNKVKACLGATGSLTKYMVSLAPTILTATLEGAELSGNIESADFCTSVFTDCDVTGVGTEMILNRCIPTETGTPTNTTERCISPLSFTPCNVSSTTRFDVNCAHDEDGNYYETLYKPTYVYGAGYFTAKLEGDSKSDCVTKQTYTENLSEELASSDQLSYIIDAIKSVSALFADIIVAWQAIVVVGFGACMIMSWFYVGLLRFCAPLLVWGSCILLELIFLVLAPWLLVRGGVIDINALISDSGQSLSPSASAGVAQVTNNALMNEAAEAEKQYYVWAGYVMAAMAFVWFCCLIFLRKAIRMAIKIIQISTMVSKRARMHHVNGKQCSLTIFFLLLLSFFNKSYFVIAQVISFYSKTPQKQVFFF